MPLHRVPNHPAAGCVALLSAASPSRGTQRVCSHGHSPLGKKEEGKNVLLSIYECPAFPAARLKALTYFHSLFPISHSLSLSHFSVN